MDASEDVMERAAQTVFAKMPDAMGLFAPFQAVMAERYPAAEVDVQKTQVTYRAPKVFCCASLLRARRDAELPKPYLTVTIGLPEPPEGPRIAQRVEIRPGRWTIHIVVGGEDDMDEGLFELIDAAYTYVTE